MLENSPSRPLFLPTACSVSSAAEGAIRTLGIDWIPILQCPANFPMATFEVAISQLVHHPEYNSTLILRSETISDCDDPLEFSHDVPHVEGQNPLRVIHRRLLPRRPGRDAGMEQYCSLFSSDQDGGNVPSVLVLTPLVSDGSPLPYYHPAVSHLAFRFIDGDEPILRIDAIPLSGTTTDSNSRLYRTCLSLLETLHRYSWGAISNYRKRVIHDCIVSREAYQDLYLILRERHRYLVNEWHESTDPLKHVYEDIGIATFLILLWKDMYGDQSAQGYHPGVRDTTHEPWKSWPRPSSGFVDLGCGNGLLTHILVSEGYAGHGVDVRARVSWSHYTPESQAHLHVHALDPTGSSESNDPYIKPGVFVIGNHADELTPWVPIISTFYSASGYLSIPCCAWSFDSKYERSTTPTFPLPRDNFADTLNLGGDGSNSSSYSMYRIWLASLSHHCGWEVECEMLRIPSTRNWALVGRRRTGDPSTANDNVRNIIENVQDRGVFKTRKPEGKASDH